MLTIINFVPPVFVLQTYFFFFNFARCLGVKRRIFIIDLGCGAFSFLKGSRPKTLHSMTKVGSGYTMSELEDLIARLSRHTSKRQPPNVVVTREKPDVWFIPEKSCVLQVGFFSLFHHFMQYECTLITFTNFLYLLQCGVCGHILTVVCRPRSIIITIL